LRSRAAGDKTDLVAEREPSLLKSDAGPEPEASEDANTEPTAAPRTSAPSITTEPMFSAPKPVDKPVIPREEVKLPRDKSRAPVVHVVGFWKRAVAAMVDLAIVIPTAMLITFLVSKITGVRLPSEKLRLLDLDLWIDLVLATDPAIVMGIVLFLAVGITYLFVFHLLQGRTLGMRLLKMRVIDVYGDRPSPARCAARCAGYLASVATLFLGFLWMGFDSEKRGLQDWLAGTYVIRA
jgi:resuscitation-promoting factor RpfA